MGPSPTARQIRISYSTFHPCPGYCASSIAACSGVAQTALALMRWASENKCARMEDAALADGLRAALASLEPEKAQAFLDNYAKISGMTLDAMGLNPETMYSAERSQPFRDADLADALELLASSTESVCAVEILDAAIVGAKG